MEWQVNYVLGGCHPLALHTQQHPKRATVKAGTQERGTERGTEVSAPKIRWACMRTLWMRTWLYQSYNIYAQSLGLLVYYNEIRACTVVLRSRADSFGLPEAGSFALRWGLWRRNDLLALVERRIYICIIFFKDMLLGLRRMTVLLHKVAAGKAIPLIVASCIISV